MTNSIVLYDIIISENGPGGTHHPQIKTERRTAKSNTQVAQQKRAYRRRCSPKTRCSIIFIQLLVSSDRRSAVGG
jgi:hypothetical protein